MTIWPFIFVRKGVKVDDELIRHEKIHAKQQLEMLLIPFFVWYVLEWLIRLAIYRDSSKAYRKISFEQEAYGNQHVINYHRQWFSWLDYLC